MAAGAAIGAKAAHRAAGRRRGFGDSRHRLDHNDGVDNRPRREEENVAGGVPASEVYELSVTAIEVSAARSILRSAWAWFVETSVWAGEIFGSVPRNDVVIQIVRRDSGEAVRDYHCKDDYEARSLEQGLSDDLDRLTKVEFEEELGL